MALFSFAPLEALADDSNQSALPGWMAKLTQAQMDTLFELLSNEGVDVVEHKNPEFGSVWIGTTNGVSYTTDLGQEWITFDVASEGGLAANNVSALFAWGDTIWIATVASETFNNLSVNVGQGMQFSLDAGQTWLSPTDQNGVMENATTGISRLTFDIAGDGERTFSANFVGGLIGSGDGGVTWYRFHLTTADSDWYIDQLGTPPLSSRYFSVVADTGHFDTTIFWAGNACGLARYDFVGKHIKPASNRILDHGYDPFTGSIFLAGDHGLSRGRAADYTGWSSVFAEDGTGLPGNFVNEVHHFGGKLFVGCLDSLDGDGIGFVWTDPDLLGDFFDITGAGIDAVSSQAGAAVYELIDYSIRYLYLAGGTAGLFVSVDTGISWNAIPTGLGGRGSVYSLETDSAGALWCGTDSGLVTLFIDRSDQTGALVDSQVNFTMLDHSDLNSLADGGSVRDIEMQYFEDTLNPGVFDSVVVWTANHPASDTGSYSVSRFETGIFPLVEDTVLSRTSRVHQIESRGVNLYLAGVDGFRGLVVTPLGYQPQDFNSMEDTSRTPRLVKPVGRAQSIFMHDSLTHVSLDNFAIPFFAVTHKNPLSSRNWRIAVANTDDFLQDSFVHYKSTFIRIDTLLDTMGLIIDTTDIIDSVLPGAFIPALAVQYDPLGGGSPPIIWAACRPGDVGAPDPFVFCFDPVGLRTAAKFDFSEPENTRKWRAVSGLEQEIWNFAFDGAEVYVATTEGLFWSNNPDGPFTQVDLTSSNPDIDIVPNASVNGVKVINGDLWVATEDGFAVRPFGATLFEVFKAVPPDGVFAYPVPFNPGADTRLDFKYQMPDDATSSTIEIYDFAMNLVRRVTNNEPQPAGEVRNGVPSDSWDGLNGKGEPVVPGIYYFKVSFSSGEPSWGKLVVIP